MKREEIKQGQYIVVVGSYVTLIEGELLGRWEVIDIDLVGNYYLCKKDGGLLIKKLEDLRFDGHKPQYSEPVYFPHSQPPILLRQLFNCSFFKE